MGCSSHGYMDVDAEAHRHGSLKRCTWMSQLMTGGSL